MPAAANGERVPRKLTIMIITDDLVETFLKCPTKCFFRSCGEVGAGNAYAAWVRIKNNVFRLEGTKRLVAGVALTNVLSAHRRWEALSRLNGVWV
jgi:hypothetical protein